MTATAWLKAAARRLPALGALLAARDQLVRERALLIGMMEQRHVDIDNAVARIEALLFDHRFVPPGHFYSPIPDLAEIERDAARLFAPPARSLPGIDLREPAQLDLLAQFRPYFAELPFEAQPGPGRRFGYDNGAFSYGDAMTLFCMLRHRKPRRVIEIGSGHSSCVALDTDELFLGGQTDFLFIEPFPAVLHSLLGSGDAERVTILPKRLQDVDPSVVDTLGSGDILFVDSTHVGKVGSDVNVIFNDILPRLAPGVAVHFHDVFYPFEYPREWIEQGRAWNEAYMLRCFLQNNDRFRILFWNDFLARFHTDLFRRELPLFLVNPGAGLWLEVA